MQNKHGTNNSEDDGGFRMVKRTKGKKYKIKYKNRLEQNKIKPLLLTMSGKQTGKTA